MVSQGPETRPSPKRLPRLVSPVSFFPRDSVDRSHYILRWRRLLSFADHKSPGFGPLSSSTPLTNAATGNLCTPLFPTTSTRSCGSGSLSKVVPNPGTVLVSGWSHFDSSWKCSSSATSNVPRWITISRSFSGPDWPVLAKFEVIAACWRIGRVHLTSMFCTGVDYGTGEFQWAEIVCAFTVDA